MVTNFPSIKEFIVVPRSLKEVVVFISGWRWKHFLETRGKKRISQKRRTWESKPFPILKKIYLSYANPDLTISRNSNVTSIPLNRKKEYCISGATLRTPNHHFHFNYQYQVVNKINIAVDWEVKLFKLNELEINLQETELERRKEGHARRIRWKALW